MMPYILLRLVSCKPLVMCEWYSGLSVIRTKDMVIPLWTCSPLCSKARVHARYRIRSRWNKYQLVSVRRIGDELLVHRELYLVTEHDGQTTQGREVR